MPKTYSVKETASLLGFSANTIYSFLNTKKMHGIRIGKGRFRIPQSEIDRILGVSSSLSQEGVSSGVPFAKKRIEMPFFEQQTSREHLSLVDWYIGLGSIIFGLSMFIYTTAIEFIALPQFTIWYWILRCVFIFFGAGFLLSKLIPRIPPFWAVVYQYALIVSFAWFTVISHLAHDPQGTCVGIVICFLMTVHLFFLPSYHSLIAITVLFIAGLNTVLFIFFPDVLSAMLFSFGAAAPLSLWRSAVFIGIPYVVYLLLVISHKVTPKLYYLLIIIGSVLCFVLGYFNGVELYWRQGMSFLFTGLVLFLYVTWETPVLKRCKKTWMSWEVFGVLFAMFLVVIGSLKIFELTMFDVANRELQVKAENGKLYLETIFSYANNTFQVYTEGTTLTSDLKVKDRTALTRYTKKLYEQFPHMDRIVVLDKDGTELANYPEDREIFGRNFAYRPYFQSALTGGQMRVFDVVQTTGTIKRYTLVIATPIMGKDGVHGVVVGSFDMDELGRNLQSFAADEYGEYFGVLDRKGVRLINPNRSVVGVSIAKEDVAKFDTMSYWKTHLDTRIDSQGVLVLSTYRTISYGNLRLAIVKPYRENLRTRLIALTITITVGVYGYISILITWYVCYKENKKIGMRG